MVQQLYLMVSKPSLILWFPANARMNVFISSSSSHFCFDSISNRSSLSPLVNAEHLIYEHNTHLFTLNRYYSQILFFICVMFIPTWDRQHVVMETIWESTIPEKLHFRSHLSTFYLAMCWSTRSILVHRSLDCTFCGLCKQLFVSVRLVKLFRRHKSPLSLDSTCFLII